MYVQLQLPMPTVCQSENTVLWHVMFSSTAQLLKSPVLPLHAILGYLLYMSKSYCKLVLHVTYSYLDVGPEKMIEDSNSTQAKTAD